MVYWVLATWRCASYGGILGAYYIEVCLILLQRGYFLHIWRCASYSSIVGTSFMGVSSMLIMNGVADELVPISSSMFKYSLLFGIKFTLLCVCVCVCVCGSM